jgi:hypothetical protein
MLILFKPFILYIKLSIYKLFKNEINTVVIKNIYISYYYY